MMSGLNLAARATRHLWPDIVCFIRAPDHYESTKAVLHFIENYACVFPPSHLPLMPADLEISAPRVHSAGRSFASRQPAPSDFYSAAVARQARPPLPPSRDSAPRPLLTQVPPAAPAPQTMTPPPDQFIQRACDYRSQGNEPDPSPFVQPRENRRNRFARSVTACPLCSASSPISPTVCLSLTLPEPCADLAMQIRPISTRPRNGSPRSTRRSTPDAPNGSSRRRSSTPRCRLCSSSRPTPSRVSSWSCLL